MITTGSDHTYAVSEDILDRQFKRDAPCTAWVSDITYIHTKEGFLYLAGIKDLFTKEIVGYCMKDSMDTGLVLTALERAWQCHRPGKGLILWSDRGSQYCSHRYQEKVNGYGMICSMSRKGECHDDAPMESFWSLLKNDIVHGRIFSTRRQAKDIISEYINIFYNRQRRQAGLGYLSPAAFARAHWRKNAAIAA